MPGLSSRYVLDEMEAWEMAAILRHLDFTQRGAWERARVLAYIVAQTHSSKKLKPSEIIPLPWDEEHGDGEGTAAPTGAEFEELKRRAEEISKYL